MACKKCPFVDECPNYDEENYVCNNSAGMYGYNFPGCYKEMLEKKRRKNKRRKNHEK